MQKHQNRRVLLVEDERNLAFSLTINLRAEGFEVVRADNGNRALDLYHQKGPFAAIILDLMLPGLDGFEVAASIRKHDTTAGILILTAKANEEDRVRGLSIGADDYLTKPFHLKELLLRVNRMAQRSNRFQQLGEPNPLKDLNLSTCLCAGPFTLDRENLLLTFPKGSFNLTSLESNLLGIFFSYPNCILTRKYLLKKVWGLGGDIETRTVDNFVLRLRRFLEEEPTSSLYLQSIRGKGYKLVVNGLKPNPVGGPF